MVTVPATLSARSLSYASKPIFVSLGITEMFVKFYTNNMLCILFYSILRQHSLSYFTHSEFWYGACLHL